MNEANAEKTKVKIDPDLEELIPQFMENTRKDVSSAALALSQNDLETVRRIGHSMKGYGSGYGFEYISSAGKAIEDAAKNSNASAISHLLGEMIIYLDNIKVIYVD